MNVHSSAVSVSPKVDATPMSIHGGTEKGHVAYLRGLQQNGLQNKQEHSTDARDNTGDP